MSTFFFVLRITLAWLGVFLTSLIIYNATARGTMPWPIVLASLGGIAWAAVSAFSHVRRVRLISDRVDANALANRHRRQIEMPIEAGAAFDIVDQIVRELPYVETVESIRSSLRIRARVKRMDPYMSSKKGPKEATGMTGAMRNQVLAIVTPGEGTSSVTVICEPEGGAWLDWFCADDGTNLENMESISRALTRRIAELRRAEQEDARQTATHKELAVAKLSLLHAQVEPHFLYNTLASAQYLTRSDPARADQMLGHLITYLRKSLPRGDEGPSTLGEELERAMAYLEILKIRMGERLAMQVQIPDALKAVPMPPMMLQTLVENAIKHGLEPVTGGGTVWILARESDGKVAVTVADDGRGFHPETAGTGIGLKNVRERLKLEYGDAASFAIVANFPKGVAATITVPVAGPQGGAHA
ncbi:sensor histidine kinase [Betaproteobacteria bacterium GR16-43]|nr:sensor histidine kinase [Betaproteobacteria bacterium GR16-43]